MESLLVPLVVLHLLFHLLLGAVSLFVPRICGDTRKAHEHAHPAPHLKRIRFKCSAGWVCAFVRLIFLCPPTGTTDSTSGRSDALLAPTARFDT